MVDARSASFYSMDVADEEELFIFDIDPLQPIFMPAATADFVNVVLTWALVAWALRLLLKTLMLRDLVIAAHTGRLSVHHSVPLHSVVYPLDPPVRMRFLGYLRSRVPDAPTAAVVAYFNPISLHATRLSLPAATDRSRMPSPTPSPMLSIELDCTLPATLQVFWKTSAGAVCCCSQG